MVLTMLYRAALVRSFTAKTICARGKHSLTFHRCAMGPSLSAKARGRGAEIGGRHSVGDGRRALDDGACVDAPR